MAETMGALLRALLVMLGAVPLPDGIALGQMLGVAAILIAAAVIAVAITVLAPSAGTRSAPHPRRARDASALLAQSDPDAAGHPRPRAPGVAPAA